MIIAHKSKLLKSTYFFYSSNLFEMLAQKKSLTEVKLVQNMTEDGYQVT